MKKYKTSTLSRAVKRAMLTEEISCLKARLDFGHLPKSDMAELSRMIKLRKTGLRKL
ncbi:MAG: hypothetical protein ABIG11_04335 [bacterium]